MEYTQYYPNNIIYQDKLSSVILTAFFYALQLRTKFNSPWPFWCHRWQDADRYKNIHSAQLSMNIHSGPPQNPQVLRPCPVYITEPYPPHTIFCCISRKYSITQFLGSLVFKLGLMANITNSKQGHSSPASCTLPAGPKIACVSRVHASVSM